MENKTALVIDIEVLLTYNLFNTEAEKVTKYENLTLGIKNIWKLNSVFTSSLGISMEEVVTQNFVKYLGNIGFTSNMLRVGQKKYSYKCVTVSKFLKFLGHAAVSWGLG